MPENKKTVSTAELFGSSEPTKPKGKTISTAELFAEESKPGVTADDAAYSVYKVARNVPIIGELAARAGDYVSAGLSHTPLSESLGLPKDSSPSEIRAVREAKEMNFETDHPTLSAGAGIAGAFVNPVPFLGVASKAGQVAAKAPSFGNKAAQLAGVATREGVVAGTDVAIRGGDIGDTLKTVGVTAGTVGALGGAAKALPALGKGVAKYGLGIADPDKIAAKYSARKGLINAADEENLLDQVVGKADEFRGANAKAAEMTDIARKEYSAAKEALRAEIRGTRPPENLAKEVLGSVNDLAAKVSEGSSKAFDVLANSDVEVPLPKIKAFLTQKINQYKSPNKTNYPGAEAEFAELAQWREYFDNIGGKTARPEEIKGLIQYLDRKTGPIYAKRVDERSLGERDLLEFRKFMDSFLKEDVPGYAEAMGSVAKEAALLKNARKMFNGELNTDKTLDRIGKPFKEKELQILKDLSQTTGKDLIAPMQEYMSAQRSISGPSFGQKAEQLPEFGQMKQIETARDNLKEQTKFATRFTREGTQAQLKRLRSVTQDPIMLRRDLEELSKQSGVDFIQLNDDLAVKEAFQKGFTHGSRNVNLGAISGQAAFSALGKIGEKLPLIGPVIGAVGGAVIDRSGPFIFKTYLDLAQSPIYQKTALKILEAAERGPQVAAQVQKQAMLEDPEFKAAVEAHVQGQLAAENENRKKSGFEIPAQSQFSIPGR